MTILYIATVTIIVALIAKVTIGFPILGGVIPYLGFRRAAGRA